MNMNLVNLALCIGIVGAFAPFWSSPLVRSSRNVLFAGTTEQIIFYSPNFQRHVVAEFDGPTCRRVFESFLFLDEAEQHYPNAHRVLTKHSSKLESIAGLGLEGREQYLQACQSRPIGQIPATLPSTCHATQLHRFRAVCDKLTSTIGSSFIKFFPEDEQDLVCERILFLLAPLSEVQEDMDWPKRYFEGYGAGLTDAQVVSAILGLRHLLLSNPASVNREKPPIAYFITALGVTVDGLNQARDALSTWLDGECAADVATFAHLRSLGISWDQCYVLLQAFAASILSCELERTWDIYKGPTRNPLPESSINYLRERFQMFPSEICCMLRTHSRLSTYSAKLLKAHSDALQKHFGFSSRDLRELVLRSPSVLGVSEHKIAMRASFFKETLMLSSSDMNKILRQVPSILEYSLERNLEPKVNFLIHDVRISVKDLTKAVVARPFILSSSLQKSLKPCVYGLQRRCQLSSDELSDIISRVPVLLSSNWKTNLEPKLNFLASNLNLDDIALKRLVISSPRLLTHSVATSLKPKLKILEDSSGGNTTKVSQVVQDNPSLLELSKQALSRRIMMLRLRNVTFDEAFLSRRSSLADQLGNQRRPLARRKRPVFEMSSEGIGQCWPDVESAACSIGASRGNMYNILKTGRTYNGKNYVYGSLPEMEELETSAKTTTTVRDYEVELSLRDILQKSSQLTTTASSNDVVGTSTTTKVYLAAYVSSGVYPSTMVTIRGVRQSGGSLMYFPQLKGSELATNLLEFAIQRTIDTQVLPEDAGTKYREGAVLSFYPGTQPSRNRVGLWVCSNTLRVVVELIASDPTLKMYDVIVDVITDSTYLVDLLQDPGALLKWGSHTRRKDFVYDGPEPHWTVNTDLLYPLARTYYRVTNQMLATPKYGNRKDPIAKSITIRFRHQSEYDWTGEDQTVLNGYKMAKMAAQWQHERDQSHAFVWQSTKAKLAA